MSIVASVVALSLTLIFPLVARAVTKVSVEDGRWQDIRWMPGGAPPGPTDSVIVSSDVSDMPGTGVGHVVVNNIGRLVITGRMATVAGLVNAGRVVIDSTATLQIDGDLRNLGRITGAGAIEMRKAGGSISSERSLGSIVVDVLGGGSVRAEGSLNVGSLAIGDDSMMILDSHSLTVRGSYRSSRTRTSLIATTGVVTIIGHVRGVIDASTVLGDGTVPLRAGDVPEVSGSIGRAGAVVTVRDHRRSRFCRFTGQIIVARGATLELDGIGLRATGVIDGDVIVDGTLTATDENYMFEISGSLFNRGRVRTCVISLRGTGRSVVTEGGQWRGETSLRYAGATGDTLRLMGDVDVRELTIAGSSESDSNVVVAADSSVLRIRHRFASDMLRGCRLLCAGRVHFYDSIDGIVDGRVFIEGFWGSGISGRIGREHDTVTLISPRSITGPTVIGGVLDQRPRGRLTIQSDLELAKGSELVARNMIATGSTLRVADSLLLTGDIRGGGVLEITGAATHLLSSASIRDSVILRIGRDDAPTVLELRGNLTAANIEVAAGSVIRYGADALLLATGTMRHRRRFNEGFNLASVAVATASASAEASFAGANSDVFAFDDTYVAVDTTIPGRGYWVSYPSASVVEQTGAFVAPGVGVAVRAGWNIIGCSSVQTNVQSIQAIGTVIASGPYDEVATLVDRLTPGHAYWVETSTDGVLLLR